ncbi:MAG: DUF4446 family protein [Actinomycetes bacterium]
MTLDAQTAGIIAIVAGVLALVALVVMFVLSAQISGMRRDYTLLQDHDGKESFVGVVARKTEEVGLLREQVELLHAELVHTREELSAAIRHVSVVRFDAFGDMGGRMSFTAAMVDDHGDGVVLTTIHARAESRTYIRALRRGEADSTLSPEENQAVEQVMGDLR